MTEETPLTLVMPKVKPGMARLIIASSDEHGNVTYAAAEVTAAEWASWTARQAADRAIMPMLYGLCDRRDTKARHG